MTCKPVDPLPFVGLGNEYYKKVYIVDGKHQRYGMFQPRRVHIAA